MSFGSDIKTISISGMILVEHSSKEQIDITLCKKSSANSVA